MSNGKNPYDIETPEWQLFELASSAECQVNAWAADAERLQQRVQILREKAQKFWAALIKLDPSAATKGNQP